MGRRKIQQIEELPLILGVRDCARLLGVSKEAFYLRRKSGDWPPTFNRYGRPMWHRAVVEAFMRGEQPDAPVTAQAQVA